LSLVTSEELFQRFPHFREGELSKLRAHWSVKALIRVAQQLELGTTCGWGGARKRAADAARRLCWSMPSKPSWLRFIWMAVLKWLANLLSGM